MMIKPAMMQATVQQTQNMTGIKQHEDSRAYIAQTNAQTTVQKEVQQKAQNVNKKEDADYNQQKYDAKEKGKNEYFSQSKKGKNEEDSDEEDGRVILKKRASFDMKV